MWNDYLFTLIEKLKDPSASSSLLPLVIIISVFFLLSIIFGVLFLLRMRRPKVGLPTKTDRYRNVVLILLNRSAAIRNFMKRVLVGFDENQAKQIVAELDLLRQRIAQLEQENSSVRSLHAAALRRVAELQGELHTMEKKRTEDKKKMTILDERRAKMQQRAENMEAQLMEVISEIEKINRDNAEVIEFQQISGKLGDMLRAFNSEGGAKGHQKAHSSNPSQAPATNQAVAAKDAQIKELKDLLLICKRRIIELSKPK
ncbi:MAG: hypothetical protein HY537_03330 [Deltaproteobacteria bacterium]|nr:hypothetical protein [Deltaproteobacteria bacterium]